MAWYSLYKWFRPWSKREFIHMISWYKDYLYKQWYSSLSEEDKIAVDRIKAEEKISYKRSLLGLAMLYSKCYEPNEIKRIYTGKY